ncbi:MAG: DUF2914 domain-containing protein [Deltaproteobacteria bacterium]|nr:MAG: DUF2914 domain-containing protein [Deltaproteobacteria bacterium]
MVNLTTGRSVGQRGHRVLAALALLLGVFPPPFMAEGRGSTQGAAPLRIEKLRMGRGVKNRELWGEDRRFSRYERVYLWVHVVGGPSAPIEAVWQHEGKEVYTHHLPIDGPSWRTWAYKTVDLPGEWIVTLLAPGGVILGEARFLVTETPQPQSWQGRYLFVEDSPNRDDFGVHVFHRLRIFQEEGKWWALLQTRGPQRHESFRCRIGMKGGQIDLYLDKTLVGEDRWERGTHLLSLARSVTPRGLRLRTLWGAYRPRLSATSEEGFAPLSERMSSLFGE